MESMKKKDMWGLIFLLKKHKATHVKKMCMSRKNFKVKTKRYMTRLARKDYTKKANIDYNKVFCFSHPYDYHENS